MAPEFAETESWGMGTVIFHRVYGPSPSEVLRATGEETARLERLLSRFLPDSDVGRLNAAAGREPVGISEETADVLSLALELSERSRGAFDATVAPLVDLWRVLERGSSPPSRAEIRKFLPLVDHRGLLLDAVQKTAGLRRKGQAVDLGGIGKGYAADRIADVFKRCGVTSAFTNFGGNVAALGAKPDGSTWRVGIRHPRKSGELIGAVFVTDASVVTSGDDQRFFVASDGRRYHHILDPRTGYPSESGLASATVVAESSVLADGLSTALFVLGADKGLQVLKFYPGAEAVLAGMDMTVTVTGGLAEAFTPADGVKIKRL
jgi:FAD:protein FMN transferase